MDKQKQIEEMAKHIRLKTTYAHPVKLAEELYNIAIPENAVVLTREEYNGKEILVEMSGGHKLRMTVGKFAEMSKVLEEYTRKETAEKFAEMAKELLDKQEKGWSANMIWIITAKNCIDEICKEITEGKNEQSNE